MNVIGTGLSGLVGSRIVELLSPEFFFENLSLETGVDITQKDVVAKRIKASDAPWVFHFAAKTDVDGAEHERTLGEKSPTWMVNVTATEHIADICRTTKKKLLYISTDYVFDGTKDEYNEEDVPNPQGWYALTKYEGEKCATKLGDQALIIRIANPYKRKTTGKADFVHKIIDRLRANGQLYAPTDQLIIPTFIDDIARALAVLVDNNTFGLYHVVGSLALSPFDILRKIAVSFGFDERLILPTTFEQYFQGRAPRPKRAVLKHDKITKFGVKMSTFDEGLATIKDQN